MLPCVYLIRKNKQDWWLRKLDEDHDIATWTGKPSRAHIFSSHSACEEYIAKYMGDRGPVVVDQRIMSPYSTGFWR